MNIRCFTAPAVVLLAVSLFATCRAPADVDYGDGSSATLTQKAWVANGAKQWADAIAYTTKCIQSYGSLALDQEKNVASAHPETNKGTWALNDVATCYFIRGMAREGAGKINDAMADYRYVMDNFKYAQCQDDKNNFWKPADACKDKLGALLVNHPTADVIASIDLNTITVKGASANTTYRITGSTKILFKGQPTNLTDIRAGMAVTVTPAANATVADTINADDPPKKQ